MLFRDNLAEVLAAAVGERQMEAKFRQWLQRCHATLDKSVRFEALADSRTQVGHCRRLTRPCWLTSCILLGCDGLCAPPSRKEGLQPVALDRHGRLFCTARQACTVQGCAINFAISMGVSKN